MRIKTLLGVGLSVVLLNACSSYEDPPTTQEPTADKPIAIEHVPVEKVCSILNGIISSPAVPENATRGVTISPSNVTAFNANGEMLTRADNDEARYYLMDIPELEMYAIMGAHTTVPPLLVLANGSATAEPVQEDDELKNYIANLPNSPNNWIVPIDTTNQGPLPVDTTSLDFQTVCVYDYDNATFSLLNGVTPIDMKWGPQHPYNMYLQGGDDERGHYDHAAVCCGAMSFVMILTHPKYRPQPFGPKKVFDWQKMWDFKYEDYTDLYPGQFDGVVEDIAYLLNRVSQPDCLNVTPGRDVSSFNPYYMSNAFRRFNLQCKRSYIDYDYTELEKEISNGYPTIITGLAIPDTTGGDDILGHSWVCSAILEAKVPYKIVPIEQMPDPNINIVIDSGVRTFKLLHHNWGWGKDKRFSPPRDFNGYYYESSEIKSGSDIKFDEGFGLVIRKPKSLGTYRNFFLWLEIRSEAMEDSCNALSTNTPHINR